MYASWFFASCSKKRAAQICCWKAPLFFSFSLAEIARHRFAQSHALLQNLQWLHWKYTGKRSAKSKLVCIYPKPQRYEPCGDNLAVRLYMKQSSQFHRDWFSFPPLPAPTSLIAFRGTTNLANSPNAQKRQWVPNTHDFCAYSCRQYPGIIWPDRRKARASCLAARTSCT